MILPNLAPESQHSNVDDMSWGPVPCHEKSQVDRESSAVQSHTATNSTELEGRVLQQLSFVRLLDLRYLYSLPETNSQSP